MDECEVGPLKKKYLPTFEVTERVLIYDSSMTPGRRPWPNSQVCAPMWPPVRPPMRTCPYCLYRLYGLPILEKAGEGRNPSHTHLHIQPTELETRLSAIEQVVSEEDVTLIPWYPGIPLWCHSILVS